MNNELYTNQQHFQSTILHVFATFLKALFFISLKTLNL